MAYSTVTIQLAGSSYNAISNTTSNSTTLTLTTSSHSDAVFFVQNIGAWVVDNSGIYYPRTAILSITIS